MNMHSTTLANLSNEWHKHPDDNGIVLTSNIEAFKAAASTSDDTVRAIILKRSEEEKQKTREEIQAYRENKDSILRFGHFEKQISWNRDGYVYMPPAFVLEVAPQKMKATDIPKTVTDIISIFHEITQRKPLTVSLIEKWRHNKENDFHKPHGRTLNFVSFSKGTVLPMNSGHLQVDEGDFLFLKHHCPHFPELATDENTNDDRFTAAVRTATGAFLETIGSTPTFL